MGTFNACVFDARDTIAKKLASHSREQWYPQTLQAILESKPRCCGQMTSKVHVNANVNLLSHFCHYLFVWLFQFPHLTGRKKRPEEWPGWPFLLGAGGEKKTEYQLQNFTLLVWVAGLTFVPPFSFWRRLTESHVNSKYQRLWKYRRDIKYQKKA